MWNDSLVGSCSGLWAILLYLTYLWGPGTVSPMGFGLGSSTLKLPKRGRHSGAPPPLSWVPYNGSLPFRDVEFRESNSEQPRGKKPKAHNRLATIPYYANVAHNQKKVAPNYGHWLRTLDEDLQFLQAPLPGECEGAGKMCSDRNKQSAPWSSQSQDGLLQRTMTHEP